MAIFTMVDCFISVNGVTLSDHAKAVTIEDSRDVVDITAFGATNKTVAKGLGDGKFTVDFYQDFAAAKTHATLQPLISSTTPITVEVRATSAARSATNPGIVMTALLFNYNPLAGSIGDASSFSAVFQNASQTGVTYPTS
jgi:hypothetical protein